MNGKTKIKESYFMDTDGLATAVIEIIEAPYGIINVLEDENGKRCNMLVLKDESINTLKKIVNDIVYSSRLRIQAAIRMMEQIPVETITAY